jgi:hypothetical protein
VAYLLFTTYSVRIDTLDIKELVIVFEGINYVFYHATVFEVHVILSCGIALERRESTC